MKPILILLSLIVLGGCGNDLSQTDTPLDRNSVVFTSIHFRQLTLSDKNKNPQWRPIRRWTPVSSRYKKYIFGKKTLALSPLDEIRLLIVLDKSLTSKGPYPIAMQSVLLPKRNDFKRTKRLGPTYYATTKILSESDFLSTDFSSDDDRDKLIGHIGVVFQPNYRIGKQIYNGTKPLGDSKASVRNIWAAYYKDNLLAHYSYEITINGDPATRQLMSVGWQNNKRSKIDAYPVDIHEKRIHQLPIGEKKAVINSKLEYYFIDSAILFGKNKNIPYTQLLDQIKSTWLFLRIRDNTGVGMKQFIAPHSQFAKQITEEAINLAPLNISMHLDKNQQILFLDQFNWRSIIEFVVFFNSGDQALYKYQQAGLNYRELPIRATLYNSRDASTQAIEGPSVISTLINFGEKTFSKGEYIYIKEKRTDHFLFKTDINNLLEKHAFLVPERPARDRFRHYYGAHFVIDFETVYNENIGNDKSFKTDANGYYRLHLGFDTQRIGFSSIL